LQDWLFRKIKNSKIFIAIHEIFFIIHRTMDRNSVFSDGKVAYICLAFGGIFSDVCRAETLPGYVALPHFPSNETDLAPINDTAKGGQIAFPRKASPHRRRPSELPQSPGAQALPPQTPETFVPIEQNPGASAAPAKQNFFARFFGGWNSKPQSLGAQALPPQTPKTFVPIEQKQTLEHKDKDFVNTLTHTLFKDNQEQKTPQNWTQNLRDWIWRKQSNQQQKNQQNQQQQFVKNLLDIPSLPPGTSIFTGQELGRGAYGTTSTGIATSTGTAKQNVAVKAPLSEQGLENMREETEISKAILASTIQNLGKKNPKYGLIYGLGATALVLAVTQNGDLVQKQVPGATLEKTILEGRVPYDTLGHFPNNPQQAIIRTTALFLALVAIHNTGYVHSDIKSDNVMSVDDPMGSYPLCLIDFGIATKFGKPYSSFSSNGGPECVLPSFERAAIQSQILDFESKRDLASQQIKDLKSKYSIQDPRQQIKNIKDQNDVSDLASRLKEIERKRAYISKTSIDPKSLEKLQQLTERQEFLNLSILVLEEAQQSIVIPPAHPSYDIYAATPVVLASLFGEAGLQLGQELFFHNSDRPIKFQYIHDAKQLGFDGYAYFLRLLTDLNQKMLAATGRVYPEPILQNFAHLLAGMVILGPTQRLSAVEIAEALTDMGLSDWEHGFFSIQ
jgi:serine/threonine protein kinase